MPVLSTTFRLNLPASRAAWISIACCVVIVMLTGLLEWRGYRAVLANAQRDTLNLAAALDNQTAAVVAQADIAIRIVVSVVEGSRADARSGAGARDKLMTQTALQSGLPEVLVYDAEGLLVARSYSEATGPQQRVSGRDDFQHHQRTARDTLHVGRAYRPGAQAGWVIPVSRRLSRPDGSFAGMVVVPLAAQQLTAHFAELDLGQQGVVALVSGEGLLLARHPALEAAVGRDMSKMPIQSAALERGQADFRSPLDGVERIYGYSRLRGYPLTLVVGVSRAEALAGWWHTAWRDLVVVAGLLALLGYALLRNRRAALRHEQDARRLARAHRRLADLEKAIDEHAVVAITDVQGNIVHANDHFCALSKYRREELVGHNHRLLNSGHHGAEFWRQMWRTVAQGGVWKGEVLNRARDGTLYWVQATVVPFLDARGRPEQYIAIRTDITARKQAEERMQHALTQLDQANRRLSRLAAYDALTGLPNRRHFDEQAAEEFKRARRDGSALSLLMVDVDHFKAYNDHHGHAAGDECLKALAGTAAHTQRRPGDLFARWGGEEFAFLLPQTDADGAAVVAHRLMDGVQALALPHTASPLGHVTISVGLHTCRPAAGGSLGELLQGADAALYAAKRSGRHQLAICPDAAGRAPAPASHSTAGAMAA